MGDGMRRTILAGLVIVGGVAGLFGQTRVNGVSLPQEERFPSTAAFPDGGELERLLLEKIAARAEGRRLDEVLEERATVTALLAWDTLHTAGATNLTRLAASHPKYAAFLKTFLADTEWMTLYAGAGREVRETAVGIRVLADI